MISQVPQNHCRILERFGKPIKVQQSGLVFRIPILDRVKNVTRIWGSETNERGVFIELTEQITELPPKECYSRDNAKLMIDAVISWRILDPIRAVYEVDNLHTSLRQASSNIIRSEVGSLDLDEVLNARAQLNEPIVSQLSDTLLKWGLTLLRVEIQEIKTDNATSAAMLQQVESERRSRAIAAEAEGQARATLRKAEADKEAAILRAEGQARALEITAEAERLYVEKLSKELGAQEAAKILLAQKALESYGIMTSNPADKVFIPAGTHSFIDLAGSSKS